MRCRVASSKHFKHALSLLVHVVRALNSKDVGLSSASSTPLFTLFKIPRKEIELMGFLALIAKTSLKQHGLVRSR